MNDAARKVLEDALDIKQSAFECLTMEVDRCTKRLKTESDNMSELARDIEQLMDALGRPRPGPPQAQAEKLTVAGEGVGGRGATDRPKRARSTQDTDSLGMQIYTLECERDEFASQAHNLTEERDELAKKLGDAEASVRTLSRMLAEAGVKYAVTAS